MAGRMMMRLALLALSVCAFLQITAAQKVLTVGSDLGWTIPPAGIIAYDTWVILQTFEVGDILVFKFTNGEQDVAQVTKEAFLKCNTTNPIAIKKTNPANFTLDAVGDYYFTSTLERHCILGQKLAIHVSASGPGPSPSLIPKLKIKPRPTGPVNYTVGDGLGWIVPPGGEFAYAAWAHKKIFLIGDSLVFLFINGTQDVAEVSKEAYEKCETNKTIAVYSTSPTIIILNTTGEHFYTSTYPKYCALGQKLAINVTANSSSGTALSPEGALSPSALGPSALDTANSASSKVVGGYMATFFFIGMAFFY